MNGFKWNKKRVFVVLGIIFILFTSILLEVFVFNYRYWTNERCISERLSLQDDKVVLHDIKKKGNKYEITGDNPYFTINKSGYCTYIEIKSDEKLPEYQINVQHMQKNRVVKNKVHSISNLYKDSSILEIKNDLRNVRFVPQIINNDDSTCFSVLSLNVDNQFVVNYYRIAVFFSSMLLLVILVFFYQRIGTKLHLYFLLIIIFIGINIAVINPVNHSYDEREHFIRAYELSYLDFEMFGEKKVPWIEKSDNFLKKASVTYSKEAYQNIVEKNNYMKKFASTQYTHEEYYHSAAITYPFVPYIPAAIGIFMGRMLKLPFIWTFLLGRITSLLGYGFICAWCIKHIKYGKRLIFLVMLLPTLFFVSTAYSVDTYTLAFSFLLMTIWINMMTQKENIKLRQIIGFILSMSIIIMCKVTYAPLCLLIFVLPKDKFNQKMKKWKVVTGVVITSGIMSMLTFLYSQLNNLNQWAIPGVNMGEQVKWIMGNPLEYISIFVQDVFQNAVTYLMNILTSLGYNESIAPIWMIILLIVLCIVAVIDHEANQFVLTTKIKMVIGFAILCSWGLVVTALYLTFTPVGSSTIAGIQGRYWGPLIFPLLLLLKNNKVKNSFNEKNFNLSIVWVMTVVLLIVLWSILLYCCG